jgi:excisionase family DNA binding protein
MSPALSRSTTSRGGGEPSTRLLGVPEVAERLSVSKQSVYRLIYAGDLFSVKSGSRRLIPDVAVDAYIAQLVADAS